MVVTKDGYKRVLTNEETIKMFLKDGWVEFVEEKKQVKKENAKENEKIKK